MVKFSIEDINRHDRRVAIVRIGANRHDRRATIVRIGANRHDRRTAIVRIGAQHATAQSWRLHTILDLH